MLGPSMAKVNDTPIETRYPWTTPPELMGDALPDKPTDRDFAKHYGTALTVYQHQRRETIDILKDIRAHMERTAHRPPKDWVLYSIVTLDTIALAAMAWRVFGNG